MGLIGGLADTAADFWDHGPQPSRRHPGIPAGKNDRQGRRSPPEKRACGADGRKTSNDAVRGLTASYKKLQRDLKIRELILPQDMFHEGIGELVEYHFVPAGPSLPDWRRRHVTIECLSFGYPRLRWRWMSGGSLLLGRKILRHTP
jgi:hypothetical protein